MRPEGLTRLPCPAEEEGGGGGQGERERGREGEKKGESKLAKIRAQPSRDHAAGCFSLGLA